NGCTGIMQPLPPFVHREAGGVHGLVSVPVRPPETRRRDTHPDFGFFPRDGDCRSYLPPRAVYVDLKPEIFLPAPEDICRYLDAGFVFPDRKNFDERMLDDCPCIPPEGNVLPDARGSQLRPPVPAK